MEKPELPILKITCSQSCEFILNLYKTYSIEEVRQSEWYDIRKVEYLQAIQSPKEIIWKYEGRPNLLIYEEERRTYEEFLQNMDLDLNDDNNFDQLDTKYWFNNED